MILNMFLQNIRKRNSRINKIIGLWIGITFLIVNLSACSAERNTPTDTSTKEKLSVVTTIFPQYDFVREVAGEYVDLQMLLKPGEETHSYEPTPQDIIAILHADLFIYVGGENDVWVEDLLEMPEMRDVHTLKVVECVDILSEHEHEHTEACEDEHEHTEEFTDDHRHLEVDVHTFDEHVWTSPVNAISITEHITQELCELDSQNAKHYKNNCEEYVNKLEELNEQFHEVVDLAEKHTILFGDRYPFKYFEEEYGLSHYAAFSGCASDTEPSAAIMAYLIDKVEEEKIPVVLKMELSNESISQAIAEATGTEVKVFYSCHNLSAEQFEAGENYLSMMQENVNTLKEALKEWH